MTDYTFREIEVFDLSDYVGMIGWIGNKPQKIYTKEGSEIFFLHDELTDRLFETNVADRLVWKDPGEYDRVIQAFILVR